MSRKRKAECYVREPEMAAAEVDQAILLHPGKFPESALRSTFRYSAIAALLRGMLKERGACLFGLLGKVSQYLVTDGGLYKTIVAIV